MRDVAKEIRLLEIRLDHEPVTTIQPLLREVAQCVAALENVERAAAVLDLARSHSRPMYGADWDNLDVALSAYEHYREDASQ